MIATPRMGLEPSTIHYPAQDSNFLSSNPQWGIAHFTPLTPPPVFIHNFLLNINLLKLKTEKDSPRVNPDSNSHRKL